MDIHHLQYFLAVARLRHFTQAAEELRIAQPALSQSIRQLEQDLGVQLFERTSRRVQLTAAGTALVEHAERLVMDTERIRSEMSAFAGLLRGQLAIGALPAVIERQLPMLLARFHQRHAGIEVRLVEDNSEQLLALVTSGLLDMTFTHISVFQGPKELCFPAEFPPDIVALPLYSEELVALVAPEHPWVQMQPVPFAVVAQEPFIAFKPGSSIRALINAVAKYYGVTVQISFEVGSALAARSLAAAGLGVTLLPQSEALASEPRVAAVAIAAPKLVGRMCMAHRRSRELSPVAQAFMQVIREHYQN